MLNRWQALRFRVRHCTDRPNVCFEHESILMNDTIGKHHVVSATFREWVKMIIDSAAW